jgi:hypothetical protein
MNDVYDDQEFFIEVGHKGWMDGWMDGVAVPNSIGLS